MITSTRSTIALASLLAACSLSACTGQDEAAPGEEPSSTAQTAEPTTARSASSSTTTDSTSPAATTTTQPAPPSTTTSSASSTAPSSMTASSTTTSSTTTSSPETSTSPLQGEPSGCEPLELTPRSDDLATEIFVWDGSCEGAYALIRQVSKEHSVDGGPETFSSGDWSCTFRQFEGELPSGVYECTKGAYGVRWDKT